MEVIRQAIQLVSDMEKDMNDFSNRLSEPFKSFKRTMSALQELMSPLMSGKKIKTISPLILIIAEREAPASRSRVSRAFPEFNFLGIGV